MRHFTILLLLSLFLISGCGTSESGVERDGDDKDTELIDDPDYDPMTDESLTEEEQLLIRTRSNFSQHYSEAKEMIPSQFLTEIVVNEQQVDPFAGFRVQLYTTANVADADSVRDHFVVWADSTIAGYEPDAYVIFRSPNYRVRAGDFQNREHAIRFSGMLKSRYPDAWVVHDRIEPSGVPADTAKIQFKEPMPVETGNLE